MPRNKSSSTAEHEGENANHPSTPPIPAGTVRYRSSCNASSLDYPDPMNEPPPASLGRPRSSGGSNPSISSYPLSSPTSSKAKVRTTKRAYDTAELGDSSPGSPDEAAQARAERRRLPGVKRACNECRQQKAARSIHIHEVIAK